MADSRCEWRFDGKRDYVYVTWSEGTQTVEPEAKTIDAIVDLIRGYALDWPANSYGLTTVQRGEELGDIVFGRQYHVLGSRYTVPDPGALRKHGERVGGRVREFVEWWLSKPKDG